MCESKELSGSFLIASPSRDFSQGKRKGPCVKNYDAYGKQAEDMKLCMTNVLKSRLIEIRERLKQDEKESRESVKKVSSVKIKQEVSSSIQSSNILEVTEYFPKHVQEILGFCPPLLHKFKFHSDFKKQDWSGIKVKKGKFTPKEDNIIRKNLESFMAKYEFYKPDILLGLHMKHKTNNNMQSFIKDNYFHLYLGKNLNDRPLFNIYKRARVLYSPREQQGKWQKHELKYILTRQKIIGNKWSEIGEFLGRPSWHVASKYYWHRKKVQNGLWTMKENRQLKSAVKKCLTEKRSHECWHKYPWTSISKLVPTRNEHQCREHWLTVLSTKYGNSERIRWSKQDNLCLIYFMYSNIVHEEHFVDWDAVFEAFNHLVPYNYLRHHWVKLKNKEVPNHREKDHEEIVLYLYHNYFFHLLSALHLKLSDIEYWYKNKQFPKTDEIIC